MLLVVLGFIAILAAFVLTSGILGSQETSKVQREKIYLQTYAPPAYYKESDLKGYVKISDMEPNSMGFFIYPLSAGFKGTDDPYYRFMLIRLPSWLGGDKNDISSYRAYSGVDVSSHCLIKYWPDRRKIEDPCISPGYRAIDGLSYYPAIKFLRAPVEGALPKLDLSTDEEGYIYVEPPVWREDKNGVVGIGRIIPKSEIMKSSEIILESFKNSVGHDLNIPLKYPTGEVLIDISSYSPGDANIHYSTLDLPSKNASINVNFCNCTESIGKAAIQSQYERYIQFWEVEGTPILVTGSALYEGEDAKNNPSKTYYFRFVKDGYRIGLGIEQSFEEAMGFVLENFFGTDLSELKRIPIGESGRESLIDSAKSSREYALLASKYSKPYIVDVFEKTNVITFAATVSVEGAKSSWVEVTGFIDPISGQLTEPFAACYLETGQGSIQDFSKDNVLEFLENPTCVDIFEKNN